MLGQLKIRIEITEEMLKKLIYQELQNSLGEIHLDKDKITIEVKSKQNYKSEWEKAYFRAIYKQ